MKHKIKDESARRRRGLGLVLLSVWLAAAPCLPVSVAAEQGAEARTLSRQDSLERELAGGEQHAYLLTLAAGEFVRVLVWHQGRLLVLKLTHPDRQSITVFNTSEDTHDREQVAFVAEAAGAYRLEVSRAKGDGETGGTYRLVVSDWRSATPEDRDFASAERLFWQAAASDKAASPETRRQGIVKYQEALGLYQTAKEPRRIAETLNRIGLVHRTLGEYEGALSYVRRALDLNRAQKYARETADTLVNLGVITANMSDYRGSVPYYLEALAIYRREQVLRGEAEILNHLGLIYRQLGEYEQALAAARQVLEIKRAAGSKEGMAANLSITGAIYKDYGDYPKALEYQQQALLLVESLKDIRLQAIVLNNIGATHTAAGDYQRALEYFARALPLRRAAKSRGGEATTLNNIGKVHAELGDHQKALENFGLALAVRREARNRPGEISTLINIGDVSYKLGEHAKARESFGQALALAEAIFDRRREAWARYGLARVARAAGRVSDARAHLEAALELVESLRVEVADTELRASFLATTQDFYQLYIDLLMETPEEGLRQEHAALALWTNERARARNLLELLTEAGANVRAEADPRLLARERELQRRINDRSEEYGQLLGDQSKAQQAATVKADLSKLLGDYQQLRAEIRASSPRFTALTQPVPLKLGEIQQSILDNETLLLEYRLGAERSYLWAVTKNSFASHVLPGRERIEKTARRAYELLSAGGEPEQAALAAALSELSQLLLGPVAGELGRKRLLIVADGALQYLPFGALPSPQGKTTGEASPVVETSGRNSPARAAAIAPLITKHEIVTLPSVSTLAVLRREFKGRPTAKRTLALMADPVFRTDDPRVRARQGERAVRAAKTTDAKQSWRSEVSATGAADESGLKGFVRLRFSRAEAENIAGLVPEGERLKALDFAANRETALAAELGNYRYLHFATHGIVNSRSPELSGLVFSLVTEQGTAQDGFLRLHDIYQLKLGADLVVLSACQTALGKEIHGEGLIGLTRGFMYAGSPRVVASLWRVDDRATAELMRRFYQAMLREGLAPAAALRAAQVSMQGEKRWSHPRYWAAFTLQGEWR